MAEETKTKNLFLPRPISTAESGRAEKRGTRAFVERGADEREKEALKDVERKRKRAENAGPDFTVKHQEYRLAFQRLVNARKELADRSDFFLKPVTRRQKRIRDLLLRAGVRVEEPIQDVGRGLELFERGSWRQIADPSRPVPKQNKIKAQIRDIVAKMISAGVVHNHLHYGNFVVNPSGEAKLIDLSLAERHAGKPQNKEEFLKRHQSDLFAAAKLIAMLGKRYQLPQDRSRLVADAAREVNAILKHPRLKAYFKTRLAVTE